MHLEVCLLGDSKFSQVDNEGQYLEVVDSIGKDDHLIHDLGEKVDGKKVREKVGVVAYSNLPGHQGSKTKILRSQLA